MTQFVDFDAQAEEHESPCSFRLRGREWHCRHQDDVPFSAILDWMEESDARTGARRFFQVVLVPDEYDDFVALVIDDPKSGVPLGTLKAVTDFVATHVLGRPTTPPSESDDGRQTTEESSTGT